MVSIEAVVLASVVGTVIAVLAPISFVLLAAQNESKTRKEGREKC